VSRGASGVHKELHEKTGVFAAKAPCVDFSLLAERDGVSLASHCVLDFDIVLGEVVNHLELGLLLGIAVAEFSVVAGAVRVKVASSTQEYPDSPIATICSTPTEAL